MPLLQAAASLATTVVQQPTTHGCCALAASLSRLLLLQQYCCHHHQHHQQHNQQQQQQRSYAAAAGATAADIAQAIARVTRRGQAPPVLLPFAVSPAAALDAFVAYQRDACFHLHASNLLSEGQYSLAPAFLPFWLFEATISTEAIATLGRHTDKSSRRSPLVWRKMDEWRPIQQQLRVPASDAAMQVYAAFDIRRDLAEAAKPRSLDLSRAVVLSSEQLQQQHFPDPVGAAAVAGLTSSSSSSSSQAVALQLPLMRQAIAWQLCQRQLMHQQIQVAAEHLKRELSADDARGLQVRLQVHCRSAHLAFFPAYHLRYTCGEKYTPSRADIVPAEYEALIGATLTAAAGASSSSAAAAAGAAAGRATPRVAAELHPSPLKSQAAAAAAVTGVALGVMPLTSLALGLDPGLTGVAGADAVLLAVLAASGAGAVASQLPLIARNRHAAAQAEADRSFFKQYDQRETAYGAPPDDHTLWLWRDADWRKWERDEPWSWDPAKRRLQAEELFRQQAQRDVDRVQAARQLAEQSRKREEEAAREASRAGRAGGHRQQRTSSHFQEEAGTRGPHHHHQQQQHRRRHDFLGYYKALGINLGEADSGAVNSAFIKAHYKSAVMKLHPDRHVTADEATRTRSAERFRRLQVAYEVLRDAEKRRAYDQGRLVH